VSVGARCVWWLLRLAGSLPLSVLHWCGAWFGRIVLVFSPSVRNRITENLAQSGIAGVSTQTVAVELGKGVFEIAYAWTRPVETLYDIVVSGHGYAYLEEAKASGRAIIFATPHLGCYDLAGRFIESRVPMTALFSPSKTAWLTPIMQAGRVRGAARTAPANAGGVRELMRVLRGGGSIMLLPDQVPAPSSGGEGVWASFFNKPAYTMTFLPKLALQTNAIVLFFFAERLPNGKGYRVHIAAPTPIYSTDKIQAATQMNQQIEALIAYAPAQYLWSYNRYKRPAGAPPQPSMDS
jgi:Kdo2-lipid IVA lauroyltransferase/acyltransferase